MHGSQCVGTPLCHVSAGPKQPRLSSTQCRKTACPPAPFTALATPRLQGYAWLAALSQTARVQPDARACVMQRGRGELGGDARRRLLVLTGAGCSTESNLPDYRSPSGAYSRGFKPMTHQLFMSGAAQQTRYWRAPPGRRPASAAAPCAARARLPGMRCCFASVSPLYCGLATMMVFCRRYSDQCMARSTCM